MTRREEHRAKRAGAPGDKKRDKAANGSGALDYLSTHPDAGKHIERALANQ